MAATKQIQKTKQKQPTTQTAVTQKQSLEIVQTYLHGALSSIAYHRDLLPVSAFKKQYLERSDRLVYDDYANGKLNKDKSTEVSTPIQTMQRGRSKRTDKLLTWLETAVFPVLRDGRLRAVQLRLHAQSDSREKVIEAHTLFVKYDSSGALGETPAGVQVHSQDCGARTVAATTSGLALFLRQLRRFCKALPSLPETRFLSKAIIYRGQDYRPPGFVPSTTDDLMFAEADGWARCSQTFDELPSAFHATTLKITHLHQPDLPPQVPGSPIPSRLQYRNIGPRITETSEDDDTPDEIEQDAAGTSNTNDATPSTVVDEDPHASQDIVPSNKDGPSMPQPGRQPTRTFNESLDTQSSNVPRMKSALQDMLQPERLTQGDTQTQAPLRPQRLATASVFTAGGSPAPAEKAPKPFVASDSKLVFLPEVAARLESEKPGQHKKAMLLAGPKERRDENDRVVSCQCGFDGEDQNMIHCDFCETWQHLHCYGFSGSHDPRLPDDHACYQCLLGDEDAAGLSILEELALKRRVMSYALRNGLRKRTDMAKSLSISTDVAKRLQRLLLDEGLINEVTNSHKPGFAKTGLPHFVPVSDGPAYHIMIEQLFDPLVMVAKYYANSDNMPSPNAVARQLDAMRSSNMPPPATPASKLRGQRTPSIASGLDPRPSATPYITPSRAGHLLKRGPGGEDDLSIPAKRAATETRLYGLLKSIQSEQMLKAYGSSPSSVS